MQSRQRFTDQRIARIEQLKNGVNEKGEEVGVEQQIGRKRQKTPVCSTGSGRGVFTEIIPRRRLVGRQPLHVPRQQRGESLLAIGVGQLAEQAEQELRRVQIVDACRLHEAVHPRARVGSQRCHPEVVDHEE